MRKPRKFQVMGRRQAEKMYWLLQRNKPKEALEILDSFYKISTKYKDWHSK